MAGPETSTASRQAGASGELGGTGGASGLDLGAMARMASMRQAMFGVTAPPVRIARFVLLEALGAGGMGIVYAAHDPHLDRRIALKVVKPDAARGRRDEARLVREAQAMARLSHPNVVQIHEVGVWEERVYIAMELVPGRTLAAWLASGGHDWRAIVGAFIEAGRGLAAAHSVGIVHRDFKPKSECPPQTPPLPPSGRILADRGDLRRAVCRVMPRHAAVLATNWQREGDT